MITIILEEVAKTLADIYMWFTGMREPTEIAGSDMTLLIVLTALLGLPVLVIFANWRADQRRRQTSKRLAELLRGDEQGQGISTLTILVGIMIFGFMAWVVMQSTLWR